MTPSDEGARPRGLRLLSDTEERMPGQRLPMRQVREVLRLKHACGQSGHRIAAAVGISRYTAAEYLRRAAVVGITWPVRAELDDMALERKLFSPPFTPPEALRPQPDWARVHAELRRPGAFGWCGRGVEPLSPPPGPGNRTGMA
jgi:hypothetical protein